MISRAKAEVEKQCAGKSRVGNRENNLVLFYLSMHLIAKLSLSATQTWHSERCYCSDQRHRRAHCVDLPAAG